MIKMSARPRLHSSRQVVTSMARTAAILLWNSPLIAAPLLRAHMARRQGREDPTALPEAGSATAKTLDQLGALFVKMGQVLATRTDLLPAAFLLPLRRLQEHVAEVPFREINETIAREGAALHATMLSIDPQPLATGSIAQVHIAHLPKPYPRMVTVKVVKRSARRSAIDNLRVLTWLIHVASRTRWFEGIPVEPAFDELSRLMEGQLDLEIERKNLETYREILAHDPRVVVPRVVEDLCSRSVLVTEYIPDCRRIDSKASDDAARRRTISNVLSCLYRMIFVAGCFHCDLHPGNFFMLDDRRLCILDAGLTATLDREERRDFMRFFAYVAYGDGDGCARILLKTALYVDLQADQEQFRAEIASLIERSCGLAAGSFSVVGFAASLFGTMRRFGIVGSSGFSMALLALATFEGSIKEFHPELDFQAMAVPFTSSAVFGGLAR